MGQSRPNPKSDLVQGEFHVFPVSEVSVWTTTGKFLSLPGARHFRDVVFQSPETQRFPNNVVWDATATLLGAGGKSQAENWGAEPPQGHSQGLSPSRTAKLPRTGQYPSARLWSHLPGQGFYLGHFENLSNTRNAADNAPGWKNERCGCASKHRDSSR